MHVTNPGRVYRIEFDKTYFDIPRYIRLVEDRMFTMPNKSRYLLEDPRIICRFGCMVTYIWSIFITDLLLKTHLLCY